MTSNYEPTDFAAVIFNQRYSLNGTESWEDACRRIASHIASAEHNGNRQKWEDRFAEALSSAKFIPGGRIWYGSGRPKGQLLNCFVIPTDDSREGWGKTVSDMLVISGTGGGVGINFSPIRPRGTPIRGTKLSNPVEVAELLLCFVWITSTATLWSSYTRSSTK
jgi:ribonucleoside-diphosphate reductase alpha chain